MNVDPKIINIISISFLKKIMTLMTKEELFTTFYFESKDMVELAVNHALSVPLKPETVVIVRNVDFVYQGDVVRIDEYIKYNEGKLCVVTDKTCSSKFVVIPLSA